jgi:hypothetical protein
MPISPCLLVPETCKVLGLPRQPAHHKELLMKNFPRFLAVFLTAALLHTPLAAAETAGGEMIVNGSFAGKLAPWWTDTKSIKLQMVDKRDAVAVPSGAVVQEHIKVTGGRNYRLQMDIRSEGTAMGDVYVQASFRGPGVSGEWRGPSKVTIKDLCAGTGAPRLESAALVAGGGTPKWRHREVVFTAPQNADQMVLYLRKAPCSAGSAAFTGVSVTATDAPATSREEALASAITAERLPPPSPAADNEKRLQAQLVRPAAEDGKHKLAVAGKMAMRVHVGAAEDLITLQAAVDLSDMTAKIAGAQPAADLSTDAAVSEEPLLVVGRHNAIAQKIFTDADFEGLGDDGFLIRSSGPHILIAGRTPRGTMYGVNWFLDRKLGVRWLSPDFTYWPSTPDIVLPAQRERQVPRFDFREVLSAEANDKVWRQRNLMNGESHGNSYLETPPAIASWNRSWASQGIIANFYELLPPKTYQGSHPDWYAGGQLAMMNPAMRAEMARIVVERLRKVPDYKSVWFAIHDNDWGWDMDGASAAFAARHGGHPSAPRLDMMIDVANRVRAVLPGARLAFNAYHWSFTPPEGMTVPDYIMVYPMTIHVNYRDALNGPANAALGRDLAGWNAIAKHVLVWDHITNFAGFIQPTPNLLPIAGSIRFLASLPNVEGYMGEGSFNTQGGEFAALRAWMISRLLWNPEENVDALIDEFCKRFYGPAAPFITEYIRFYHSKIAETDDVLAEKTTVDMKMFDADFVRRSELLFDRAEAAVQGTPYQARVGAARIPIDYVILMRRAEYASMKDQIGFDVNDTLAQRLGRFWSAVSESKVSQYIQGEKISDLAAVFRIERKKPGKPDFAGAIEPWADIQDLSFQRFASAKSAIVVDSLASDEAAVALDRSDQGWNLQLKLDKLPETGKWWLYAAIRPDGLMSGKTIARLGSSPPMNCFVTIADPRPQTAAYQWFEVPGGPFSYSTDHGKSIYVQPIKGPEGSKILIDRIVALSDRVPATKPADAEGSCH